MSWKPEVIADSFNKWAGNATRFATKTEAEHYVAELAYRWLAVRDTRVIEVDEPVTCRWEDDRVVFLDTITRR